MRKQRLMAKIKIIVNLCGGPWISDIDLSWWQYNTQLSGKRNKYYKIYEVKWVKKLSDIAIGRVEETDR